MKFMRLMRNGRKCRCHKGLRRFLASGDFSNWERGEGGAESGKNRVEALRHRHRRLPTGREAVGNPGRFVLYAIGSGSPGGSGISKTLRVMETSM
jgi:hypothetical protein